MSMTKCEKCDEWSWNNPCKCKLFMCGEPWQNTNNVDDVCTNEIYAMDEESAAEKYSEFSDSYGDYSIIKNGNATIWVKDSSNAVTEWFVEAESEPHYYAYPEKS